MCTSKAPIVSSLVMVSEQSSKTAMRTSLGILSGTGSGPNTSTAKCISLDSYQNMIVQTGVNEHEIFLGDSVFDCSNNSLNIQIFYSLPT